MLCLYMVVMTETTVFYYTVAFFLLIIGIKGLADWIKEIPKKKSIIKDKKDIQIPIGYYLIISNIISLIICNFLK